MAHHLREVTVYIFETVDSRRTCIGLWLRWGRVLLQVGGLVVKSRVFGLMACIAMVAPAEAATYNINISEGTVAITGTITTDGTSPVGNVDVTGYNLTAANGGTTLFTLSNTGPNSPSFSITGSDLTTTATQIFFNFGDTSAAGILDITNSLPDKIEFANQLSNSPAPNGIIEIGTPGNADIDVAVTGNLLLGSVAVSATPLPATLPLFAGGLGMVGFLTRRKKQKNGAALAAV